MFGQNKKPEVPEIPVVGNEPEIPLPIFGNKEVLDRLEEIKEEIKAELAKILTNQAVIYEAIGKSESQAIVLNNEELKYIPEEDKDTYLEAKKSNPKLAERLLRSYKAESKEKK